MSQLKIADLNFIEATPLDRHELKGGIVPGNFMSVGVAAQLSPRLNVGLQLGGGLVEGFTFLINSDRAAAASVAAAAALNGQANVIANAKS